MATRQASTIAGEAPNIDEGMYDSLLVGVEEKRVKGGQYTKDLVNGDLKLEWSFLILDEAGSPVSPTVVVTKLTGTGFNIRSKTIPQEVRILRAILTKDEYAAFENGAGTPDDAVTASEGGLLGRKVQTEVFIKENGWPGVGNIVAPRGSQKGTDFLDGIPSA